MMERVLHFLIALVTFAILFATATAAAATTLSVVEMNGLGSAYAQITPPTTKIITDDATGGDCTSIGSWNSTTKTCRLTTDLSNTTIKIDSDGITLNGDGHRITGPGESGGFPGDLGGGFGVVVHYQTGVTVKNLKVNNFHIGIIAAGSDNTFVRNTAYNNEVGIGITYQGSHNTLVHNTANDNYGIGIYSYSNNTLVHNTANDNADRSINFNGWGIFLDGPNNTVILNTANDNTGWGIGCIHFDGPCDNNILIINTANLNSEFGYRDGSSGSGTSGTANTYITNECSGNGSGGSNPTGLCYHPQD
jgi:parallel beta-helix repeat protein